MQFDNSSFRLLDSFPQAVFVIDPEGTILDANGSFTKQFGLDPEKYLGSNVHEQRSDCVQSHKFLDLAELKKNAEKAFRTGIPVSFETVRNKTDQIYTIYPIRLSKENSSRLLVIVQDVTEQKKVERENHDDLSVLNAFNNNALNDIIPASIIIVDAHMRLIGWNRFSRDAINGLSDYEMYGVNPFKRVHPEDRDDMVNRAFLNVLIFNVEESVKFRMFHKDASNYKWATLRARRTIIDGQPCVVAVVTETTELKKAEDENEKLQEQLRQAQKMQLIGQLAGGIAHDFNNILAAILGNTEILLGKIDNTHPFSEKLEDIRASVTRSADLVRQLLAFARKQHVNPKILLLDDAARNLQPMLRRLIPENIQLGWRLNSNHARVCIDPSQFDQIMANLCVNARDAISGSGSITIETSLEHIDQAHNAAGFPCRIFGDYVKLAITDTGLGIDPKVLPHIFEPFFTTKEIGKGTGLGLSTIYGIVKQNNGYITCWNNPEKGATFSVYLPMFEVTLDEDEVKEPESRLEYANETILVVEDESEILKILKEVLADIGYTVLAALDAEDAMIIANKNGGHIKLLVTDIILPNMNGIELIERLREGNPELKVLFMSGYAPEEISRQRNFDAVEEVISKPFAIQDFKSAVYKVINSPSKRLMYGKDRIMAN
jgi:two-component system cell cycle sensor histidine kinase/response regulator CckA